MKKNNLTKIALLNPGAGLGDHILCLPAINTLIEAWPNATVDLITTEKTAVILPLLPPSIHFIPLKASHPLLTITSLLVTLLRGQYTGIAYVGKSPWIQLLLKLCNIPVIAGYRSQKSILSVLNASITLQDNTYIAEQHLSVAKALLGQCQKQISNTASAIPALHLQHFTSEAASPIRTCNRTRILIHPGYSAASEKKRYLKAWPNHLWAKLINTLLEEHPDSELFLLGGPEDAKTLSELKNHCETLIPSQKKRVHNLHGKTKTLQDLAAVLSAGNLLISVDSFPMHLAVSVQTPVVAIFASTNERNYLPEDTQNWVTSVSKKDLACRPCLWAKRKKSCGQPVCLHVDVQQVSEAVRTQLQRLKQKPRQQNY